MKYLLLLLLFTSTALAQTTLEGTLSASDPTLASGEHYRLHPYDAQAGENLTVVLRSDAFDPYLGILDPEGNVLTEVDDSDGYGLGAVVEVTLEQTGRYNILVTSAYVGETGGYSLSITPGGAQTSQPSQAVQPPSISAPTTAPMTPLVYPDERGYIRQDDNLSLSDPVGARGRYHLYSYDAAEGEVIALTLTTDKFRPYFAVLDPAGQVLSAEEEDYNLTFFDVDLYVTFPAAGRYSIVVASLHPEEVGGYSLSVSRWNRGMPTASAEPDSSAASNATDSAYMAVGERFALAPGARYDLLEGTYVCMGNVQVYMYSTPGAGGYLYPQYMDSYQEVSRFNLAADGTYNLGGEPYRYSYDPASGSLYWLEGDYAGRTSSFANGNISIADWNCSRQ